MQGEVISRLRRFQGGVAWLALGLLMASCHWDDDNDDQANRPPVAQAGTDQTVPLGTTVTVDGSGSTDLDGDTLHYSWTLTAPPGSGAVLTDAAAIRPSFAVDLPGTYTATLVVSDGKADSQPDSVQVDTSNSAPTADAGSDQTVALGAMVQLDGSTSADPDGDPLGYQWTMDQVPTGSAATLSDPGIPDPVFVADQPGSYVASLIVSDGSLESAPDMLMVTTANSRPVAEAGADQQVTVGDAVSLDGSASSDADGDALTFVWSLLSVPAGSTAGLSSTTTPMTSFAADAEGLYVAQLVVNDGNADSDPDTVAVESSAPGQPPDNSPPVFTSGPVVTATVGQAYQYAATATDADSDPVSFQLNESPAGMTIGAQSGVIAWTPSAAGGFDVQVQANDGRGGVATQSFQIQVQEPTGGGSDPGPGVPPPDPATVATANDPTVVTDLYDSTSFLYSGTNPVQRGVLAGTIDPRRTAVVRGRVLDRAGDPLPGIVVTVKDHAELGYTVSRDDGMFDLVVNGGGPLVIDYRADGYLPSQRRVQAEWQGWATAPDVVMVGLDPNVTVVNLPALAGIAVASGSVETDVDGSRQARVLFKPGTAAELVMPDGSTQAIESLSVRATEYTVGDRGPESMPGELPPTSGYTYAVELSVDEAMAAGATSVRFSQGVPLYVDNFLGFPTGTPVPVGYYDREAAQWLGIPDGRVIEILSVTAGLADVDGDGDGDADTTEQLVALGLDDAERERLAALYESGDSLWRAVVTHFTPYDCNWPYAPPPDAQKPNNPKPKQPGKKKTNDPCEQSGSIIECQNQVLGERVGLAGTPWSLNYRSDRVPGTGNVLDIPVITGLFPGSLLGAAVLVEVAGKVSGASFPAEPNHTFHYEWDGRDAYGRPVYGTQSATVTILHTYPLVYTQPADFPSSWARAGGDYLPVVSRRSTTVTLRQQYNVQLRYQDAREKNLGGWSLDPHHSYDPFGRTLLLGNGEQRTADGIGRIVETVAGALDWLDVDYEAFPVPALEAPVDLPAGIDLAPDGSIYYASQGHRAVFRVDPDGIVHHFAGVMTGYCDVDNETLAECGIPGPARDARFDFVSDIAVAPDGTVYVMDEGTYVYAVGTDGIIRHVAGSNDGSCRDISDDYAKECALEGIATERYMYPFGIDVDADGNLYIADLGWALTIGKVTPDGRITTVAGPMSESVWDNRPDCAREGTPAYEACTVPLDVAVGPDGTVYVLDVEGRDEATGRQITRVLTFGDGKLKVVFDQRDVDPALEHWFSSRIAVSDDNVLYLGGLWDNPRLVEVDLETGRAGFVAGTPEHASCGTGDCAVKDGLPALATPLYRTVEVATGPDGLLYFEDYIRIRRVGSPMPGLDRGNYRVPSEDGSEIYEFDRGGRHLKTLSSLTGVTLLTFDYDADGRLVAITDIDGLVTRIERNGSGDPNAIIGPYGQRTTLGLNPEGWLSEITNPAGESAQFGYGQGGLMTSITGPLNHSSVYEYDQQGLLVAHGDVEGNRSTLSLVETGDRSEVTLSGPLGRETVYAVERLADGGVVRTTTQPYGATTSLTRTPAGELIYSHPDGTMVEIREGPEPRLGMQSPMLSQMVTRTPSGLASTLTEQRVVELADENDPLSVQRIVDTVMLNGNAYSSVYDRASSTFTSTTPEGRESVRFLDEVGRAIQLVEDPALDSQLTTFNDDGRVVERQQGGMSYAYTYDALGRLATKTDALGRTTSYAYDPAGRTTQIRFPSGRTVGYGYDAAGNLVSLAMPSGAVHKLGYTPRQLASSYTAPGGDPLARQYDAGGSLGSITLPGGRTITTLYGAGGRPVGFEFPEAEVSIQYNGATDLASSVVRSPVAGGAAQQLDFAYDGSLPVAATFSGPATGGFTYSYGDDMLIESLGIDGTTIALQRDLDGLLTGVGDFTLARSGPAGRIGAIGDGTLAIQYGFAASGALAQRSHAAGGAFYTLAIEHGADGRITRRTESAGGSTTTLDYVYDLDGQLLEVRQGGAVVERYAYDVNGNRTLRQVGADSRTATYDAQDRLLALGSMDFEFDEDGFLARRGDATLRYDARGALLSATLAGGEVVSYAYDGFGRRVARTDDSGTLQYLYGNPSEPFQVTATKAPDDTLTLYYYDDAGVLFAMDRGANRYYVAADQVGSPRVVTDASGAVVKTVRYDAWGGSLEDTAPGFDLPFGFAGGLADPATGLLRFGFRDYDPVAGRWTARDPILFAGGQSNLYAYSRNDPVNLRDPSGLFCIGGSWFSKYGGAGKLCITGEGISVCGEVGFGVGGGLDIDPLGGLADQADADYNQLSAKVKCGLLAAGFEAKLDDCGKFSGGCQLGLGNFDACKGKYKFKSFDTDKIKFGQSGDPDIKLNKEKIKVDTSCKLEIKFTGGFCISSAW